MLHATGWSFLGMHLVWWAFWIVLIVTVSTTFTPVPKSQMKSGERALDILRRRFAAGELSSQEFERRKAVLERDEPTGMLPRPAGRHH